MKEFKIRSAAALVLTIFTFHPGFTASEIEGYWKNTRNDILIQVVETNDGIKVKRSDQRDWHYYDEQKQGVFEDIRGDKYLWENYDELTWKERRGGKSIRFQKSNGYGKDYNYDYGSNDGRERWNNGYRTDRFYDAYESLEGRWIIPNTNREINIRVGRRTLEARRGASKSTYRKIRNNKFRDNRGNVLKILDRNRLHFSNGHGNRTAIYRRDNGRRDIRRRNNYCY